MMTTQTEAKRFFVDKAITQAQIEGVLLSDAERGMLSWSESDPDLTIDPTLPLQLEAEMSDEEYERKIAGLLARSFSREIQGNPQAEAQWKDALAVLQRGDHYILIMLDEAVGRRWKRWWQRL